MKYKHTIDDLRLIGIGFIPALIALYIIYYLAHIIIDAITHYINTMYTIMNTKLFILLLIFNTDNDNH